MQSLNRESLRLLMVGLNHRTAPLHVRETMAFTPDQIREALSRFKTSYPRAESVILSTCNRVEMYIARPLHEEPTPEQLAKFMGEFHALPSEQFQSHLYHHEDRAMIEHLFRVTSSLDSVVVGETQILSQVKQAYQQACDAESVSKIFHTLFQRALAAAKDVHDSTNLSAGRLSVASVAVDLTRSIFDRFDDKTVLCIGAGKMASLMLRHLSGLAPRRLLLANRSLERAEKLAAEFHGEAAGLDVLDQLMIDADIILTSTGSADPIITASRFKAILKPRRYRPVIIVDIAVPRDVESAVGELNNVYLYNVDDLQEVAAGNRQKRDKEISASHDRLAVHVEEFLRWYAARDVGPLVKALYDHCHAVARAELDEYCAHHPELNAAGRQDLERLSHRLISKLLHGPVTQITHNAEVTARPMLASALKRLFSLTSEEPPEGSHQL